MPTQLPRTPDPAWVARHGIKRWFKRGLQQHFARCQKSGAQTWEIKGSAERRFSQNAEEGKKPRSNRCFFGWNLVFFSSQGFYRGQIDVFSVNFGEISWFSRSAHLAAVLATLRNRFFDEKHGIFIFDRNFARNPVTRVRGFWSIPENLWFLEGRVISWTVQKAGKSKGGIEGNHQPAPISRKLSMFSCDSTDRSIRMGKQRRNEPCGMIKKRHSTEFSAGILGFPWIWWKK